MRQSEMNEEYLLGWNMCEEAWLTVSPGTEREWLPLRWVERAQSPEATEDYSQALKLNGICPAGLGTDLLGT